MLFGGFKKVSMEELLASVPPRVVVDRLIAKSFNSMDIAPSEWTALVSMTTEFEVNFRKWLSIPQHFFKRCVVSWLSTCERFAKFLDSMNDFGNDRWIHPSCGSHCSLR